MSFRGRAQWELALRALAESLERNQGQAAPITRSSSEATADVSCSTEFLVSEWADFHEPSPSSSSSHHVAPSSMALNPLIPHTSSARPVSRSRWNDSGDHDRSRFNSERRVNEPERRFLSGVEDGAEDEDGVPIAAAVATEWAEAIAALRRFKPEGWSKMAADCAAEQHFALDTSPHLNDRRSEPPRSRPHETAGRDRRLVTANDPRSSSLHDERSYQHAARTDVDAPAPQRDDDESKEASSSSPSANLREEDPSVHASADRSLSSEVPYPRRQGRGMTPRPRPEALAEAVRIKSLRSSRFDTSGDAAWKRTLTLPLHPQTFKRRWRALCRNIHRAVLESTSSNSTQHQGLPPGALQSQAPQPTSESGEDSIDALLNPPSTSSDNAISSSPAVPGVPSSESSRPLITHEDGLIIKAWFLKREFAKISKATPTSSSSTRVKNGTHDDASAKRERLPHPFMDHQAAVSMKKGPSSTREVEGHDDGHEQVNTPAELDVADADGLDAGENEMEGTTIHDFEPDSLASDAMEQRHPDADGGEQLRVHSEVEHQDHAAPVPVVHNVDRMSSPREKTEQLAERRAQFLSFLQYQAIAMALAKGSLSHARHADAAEEMKQNNAEHETAEVARESSAADSGQVDSSSQMHPTDEHHTAEVLGHGKSKDNAAKTSHASSTEMVPTSVTRREALMLLRISGAPHAFTLDALREIDAARTSSPTASTATASDNSSSSSPSFSAPGDLEGKIVQCLSVAERRGLERLSETARTRGERAVAQASALAQRLEHSLLDALSDSKKGDMSTKIEGTAPISFEGKSSNVRHFPFSDKDWAEATRLVRWCAASPTISGSVVCLLLEPLLFSLFVHRHILNQRVSSSTSLSRSSDTSSSSLSGSILGQHNSSSERYEDVQEVATARALELTALLCAALPGTSSAPHTNQNPNMNRSTTRHLPIEVHTVWRLHDAMTRSPLLSLLLPNAMRLLPVRFAPHFSPHDSQLVSSKASSPVSPEGSTVQGFSREGCVGEQESVSSPTAAPIEKQRQKCEGDDVKQESETNTAGPIEATHRQKSVSLTWLLSRQASTTAAGRRASKAMSSLFTHHRSLFWSPVSERWLSATQPSPSSLPPSSSPTGASSTADAVSSPRSEADPGSEASRSEADLKREATPVLPSDLKSSLQSLFNKRSLEEWFSVDSVAALRPDEWTALFSKPDLRPSMRLKLLTAFLNDCDTAVADESLLDAVMASAAKCKYSPYEDHALEPRRDISSPASAPVPTPMSGHSQMMPVASAASVASATPQQLSTPSTPRFPYGQQNAMVDVSTEAQKKSVGSDPGLEVIAALLASNRIPPVLRTKVATVLTQSQLESPAQFQSRSDLDDLDSDIGSNAQTSSVRSMSTTTVVVPATMISTEPSCDVLLRGLLRHFPVTSHRSDSLLRAGFVQVMHCTSPGVNSWDGRATAALSVAYARTGEWVKAIGLLTSPKVVWSAADARRRERSVLDARRAARRLKAEEAEKEALQQTAQPVRSSFMRPKGSGADQAASTRTTSSFPNTSVSKAKKIAANEESKTRQTGAENGQANRQSSNRVEAARALAAVLCHLPPRAARVRVRSSDVSPELSSSSPSLSQHSQLSSDSHAQRSSSTPANGSGHPMGNSDHIPIDEMSPGQRRVLTTSIGAALAARLGVEGRVGTAIRRVQRYFQHDDSDSSLASRTAAAFQRNRQDMTSAEKASMSNEEEEEGEENGDTVSSARKKNDRDEKRRNDDGAKQRMSPWRKDNEKKRHPTLYPLDIVLAATASPEAHLALLGRRYQTEIERSVALLRSFAAVRLEEIPPPSHDEECHAETDNSVEKSVSGLVTERADSESAELSQRAEAQTQGDNGKEKDNDKNEEPQTALDRKLRHGRIPWAHLSLSPGIHPHVLSWFWRDTPRALWSRDLWALYMTRGTWLRAAEIVQVGLMQHQAQLSSCPSSSTSVTTSTTSTASGVEESMHAALPVVKGAEGTGTLTASSQQALVPLSSDVLNNLCNVPPSFVRTLSNSTPNRCRSTEIVSSPGTDCASQRAFKTNVSGHMRTNVGPVVSSAGLPLATAVSALNKIAARDFSAAFDSLMYLAKTGSPMVPLYRPLLTEVLSLYRDETERQQVLDAVAKKERMDSKSAQKTAEKAAIVAELKARIAAGFAKHKPRSNENDDYVAPALTKPEREVAATTTAAPSSITTAATASDAQSREPHQQQQQLYHERKDWVIRARKLLRLRLYTLDVKAGKAAHTSSTSSTGRKPNKSSSQSQTVHRKSSGMEESGMADAHSSSKPTENLRWSDLSRTNKTVSQEVAQTAAKRTGRAVSPVTGYVDPTNGESVALPSYVSSAEAQRFVKPLAFIAAAVYFLCEAEGVYLAPYIHRGMARVAATEHFGVGAVSGMLIVAANIQRKESLSRRTKSSSKSSEGQGGPATLMSSTANTNTVGSTLLLAALSADPVEIDDDGDGDSTDFSRSEVLQLLPVTTTATSDVLQSGNLAQSGDLVSDTAHTTLSGSLVLSSSGSAPSSRFPPTSSSSPENKKRITGPTQLFTRPKRKQHSVASSSTDALFEGLRETSNEDKVIRSQYVSKVTPEDLALALFACRDAAPRHGRGGRARGGSESDSDRDSSSSSFSSSSRNRDDKAKARTDHVGNKSDRAEWERVLSVVLSSPKPVRRAVPVSLWLEGLLLAADQHRERIAVSASRSRWAPTQQMPDRQGATWSQSQDDKKKSSGHGGGPEWTPPVHVTKLSHLRGAKANSVTGTHFAWLNALRIVMSRIDADERHAHDRNIAGASKEGGGQIPTELFLRACRCRELHTRILTGASVLTADEQKARHAVWATVATALAYRGAWMAALDLLRLKPTTAPPPSSTTTVTTPAAPHSSSSTSSLSSSSLRDSNSGDSESRTRWTVSKEGVTKTEVSLGDRQQFVPRHYKDIVGRLGRTVLHGNRAFLPFLSRTFPDAPLTPRSDREIVHKWQQRTPNAGSVSGHAASSSGAEARGSSEGNGPRRVPVRPSIAPVPPMAPKNPVDV